MCLFDQVWVPHELVCIAADNFPLRKEFASLAGNGRKVPRY